MGIVKKLVSSMTDIGRILRAAGYSISGLRTVIQKEAAFRQELILFVILAPLGFWLGRNGVERALFVGSLVLVLIVELLNTAVEVTIDRISKKHHELSGRAKDIGSAAVYLSLLLVVYVWAVILVDQWVGG